MTEPGTALQTLQDYERAGNFNVLAPVITIQEDGSPSDSPYLVGAVSLVRINPSPDAGEVYTDYRFANERDGKVALTSLALAKFAAAAGVKWIPDLCKILARERRGDGHLYIAYQAGAGIRSSSGEWHIEIASKELDTADIEEELTAAYERKLESGRARFKAEEIPGMVKRELMQVREHALSLVETKAKSRCIRRILSLKQVYQRDDLKRPFAVPRLVYRPDLADPMQLEQVQLEGARAASALFGGPATPTAPAEAAPSTGALSPAGVTAPTPEPAEAPPDAGEEVTPTADAAPTATAQEATPASGTTSEENVPPKPRSDPVIASGQYQGRHFSEIAAEDPAFLQGIATESRAKARRDIADAWLLWATGRTSTGATA